MTLVTHVTVNEGHAQVVIRRQYSGAINTHPEEGKLCDMLEPAIYEGVRKALMDQNLLGAVIRWDGAEFKLIAAPPTDGEVVPLEYSKGQTKNE